MKKLFTILSFVLLCTSFKSQTTLSFDGANDYVAINKSYSSPISAFTAEAWFKTNYNAGGDFVNWALICFDRSEYWHFSVEGDGRIGFHSTDVNGVIDDFHSSTNPNLVNNTWHHAAVVYDGTDKIIYVDGVEVAKKINAHSGNAIGKSGVTRFGFLGDGSEASSFNSSKNNVYYDGMISETRIWSTARTANEILASYNTALTGNEANLDLYYNFSEGSGSTLNDLSSNGVDGTIVGATWVNDNAPVITCSLSVDAGADLAVCDGGSVTLSLGNSNNGSVGFWPFDGNSNNENGTGSDGTVNGATLTSDLSGNSNSAYLFNGINNDIDLGTGVNNVFSGNSWSFSTWLYYSSNSGFDCFFSSGWPIQMYVNNNYIKVYYSSVDGTNSYLPGANSFNSSTPLSANTWYHVVVTRDGNNNSMYINGALDATSTTTGNIANSSENSRIGSWNGNDFYWEGKIDKVGIWNTAISAQEVQNLNTNYSWDNGVTDGIAFVPTATTTYTVTGTDANGCIATDAVDVTVNALPISTLTSMNALCNGSSDGSATVSSVGGTAPYSYLWDDGQTTAMAGSLSAGSYTVTVTDANGCTETQSATVTEPTALTSTLTSMNALCNGSSDGSATVSSVGGTAPYSYLWDDGQTTAMAGSLSAGSYTVTVTDANGCTETQSATVTEPTALTSTLTSMNALCNGSSDGSATVSSVGGTAPYSYLWDDGQTTAMAGSLSAGSYTVTVTDANGCTETQSATVTEPTALTSTLTSMNALCNGSSDGSATVSSVGGTAPYSYLWDDGQTTAMAGSLSAGSYTVTVTDANGCTETQSATVTEPTALTSTLTSMNALCNGSSDGSATVSSVGGTAPYSYLWDDGQTTAMAGSLSAGSYTVTVTDANGCTETQSATVTEPTALTSTLTSMNALCNGSSDGSATVSSVGGTAPYSYLWDDGQTTAMAGSLSAGSYTVTVTDANGCTETQSATVTEPTALTSTLTSMNALCNGSSDGSATVSSVGGTAPYSYLWDDGQTTAMAGSLSAGSYTVTVTDANGCTETQSATVTEPTALTSTLTSMNALCNGSSDGSATVSSVGGTAPYSYLWDDGQTTAMAGSLSAGSYTVTVTDANGCTETQSATVTEPTALTSTLTSMNALCNGSSDGSATVSSVGGTAPYSYLWDDGQTTAMAGSLSAGSYTVTVTDANGCTETQSATVTEPTALTSTLTSMNALCNGSSDGSATVSSVGGTAPYSYLWDDGQTTAMAGSLSAGSYTVTVTDANGCTETQSATVTEPTALTSTLTSMNALCNGSSDGSATVSSVGGTAPYSYLWDDGQTTAMAGSLSAGSYTVTVTDANGCTETQSATVTEPTALTSTLTSMNALCNGSSDGSATVSSVGGTAPYSYLWDDGQTTAMAGSLSAGSYTVTVTDANGCTETQSATVTEPTALTSTLTSMNALCNGSSDGSATVSSVGGTAPYSYLWDDGQTTAMAGSLSAGSYTVTVTDANGCTETQSATVTEPTALTSTLTSMNALCNGSSDGSATVSSVGGTAPYSYLWDDGQTTAMAGSLSAGSYTVTVTDANGCTETQSATVTEPTALTSTLTSMNALCNGSSDGSATVSSVGGTAPYSYLWDDGQTTAMAGSLSAGSYTVTVTDANGCTETQSATVTEPTALTSTLTSMNALCNGSSDGSATVSSVGGTAPYSYLWDDGQTTAMAGSLSAGSYTVTVTDANGCTETQSATVTEPTALIVSAGLDDTICAGDFVTLNGTGADTYIWDNTLVTDATPFSPSATATYTVTGTDANGCNATDQVIVTVNALPTVDAGFDVSVCTGSSVTLSASGAVTYAWDNNITDATAFTPTATATYTVTGTDANGCSATDAVDVSVNSLYYNTQTIGACNGDSVFAGGSYQTASGVFVDSLQSINGCDSVVQTTLTIASQIVANIPLSVCFGDSALINGNSAAVYLDSFMTLP